MAELLKPGAFCAVLGWIVPISLLVGLVGAFPTWHRAGIPGLQAELAAGVTVMIVMVASCALTAKTSAQGPGMMAYVFVISGMARVLVSVALLAAIWAATGLPARTLMVWAAIFYLTMLVAESIWICRMLGRSGRGKPATAKPTCPP
jgi:hypothetical protein